MTYDLNDNILKVSSEALNQPIIYNKIKTGAKRGYKYGRRDGDMLVWDSKQDVPRDKFFHRAYYFGGFAFQKTKKLLLDIVADRRKQRRSNMNITIKRSGVAYRDIEWSDISKHFEMDEGHKCYGYSFYNGCHQVIIWQIPSTGKWVMGTGYGFSEGIEVAVSRNAEWTLRSGLLIGWLYWMGHGKRPMPGLSLNKLLLRKEIEVSWDHVKLEIWGTTDNIRLQSSGMNIGGINWIPLTGLNKDLMVGPHIVSSHVPPTDMFNDSWREWVVSQVRMGRGVSYVNARGKTVYQNGPYMTEIWDDEWRRLRNSIIVRRIHDNHGNITVLTE